MSSEDMTRGLEKALARVAQADDRELAGRVHEDGQRLVVLLTGLIRASRLYGEDNAALDVPASELTRVLETLIDQLGAARITCVEDQVYVNDIRLRPREDEQPTFDLLIAEMDRHEAGGLSFHAAIDAGGAKRLARALSDPAGPAGRSRGSLASNLTQIEAVEVTGRGGFPVKGESHPVGRTHAEVLRRGATLTRDAFANLALGRLPNPLPVRRAVIDLIDNLRADPGRAAAAPMRRLAESFGERHVLSVTSLAIQLGQALGLPEAALSDLGVASMLHDVGYVRTPDKTSHSADGVHLLMRQRGFHEGKFRRLPAVFDHHRPFAIAPDQPRPGLFARILRIVDDYDVLTTPRPGLPLLPPPTAQASMWAARGIEYDPDLLALFVQMMGLYPPGSLLELTDGRWVLSQSGGRDPERFAWPVVRVVREADGASTDQRESLDLFETRDKLRPKRVLNPASQGLDITEILEHVFGA